MNLSYSNKITKPGNYEISAPPLVDLTFLISGKCAAGSIHLQYILEDGTCVNYTTLDGCLVLAHSDGDRMDLFHTVKSPPSGIINLVAYNFHCAEIEVRVFK